jgi:hypothetical protein
MSEEWRNEGEKTGLMRLTQTEFYVGTKDHLKIFESHPDVRLSSPFPFRENHTDTS